MKRTVSTPPLLSFVLVVRNAASTIRRTLESIRARAPECEIVVIDTCSDDYGTDAFIGKDRMLAEMADTECAEPHVAIRKRFETDGRRVLFVRMNETADIGDDNDLIPAIWFRVAPPLVAGDGSVTRLLAIAPTNIEYKFNHLGSTQDIAQEFADVFETYRGPNGDWTTEMYACDNMAAARNHAMSLATGRWVCWIDADDELPGPEETARLLRLNGKDLSAQQGVEDYAKVRGTPMTLEAWLLAFESAHPNADVIHAPYLYRADTNGSAQVWQDRERFLKNPNGRWTWVEPAHEYLTPLDGQKRPYAYLGSLLFVHRKEWEPNDHIYSIKRHHAILEKQFLAGERSPRNLWYLVSYSPIVCPHQEDMYLGEQLRAAVLPVDRVRAFIQAGQIAARKGLYLDAIGMFATAQAVRPDLPDAFYFGAVAADQADDLRHAAEAYRRAIDIGVGQPDSQITPRTVTLEARMRLASILKRAADGLVKADRQDDAMRHYETALSLAREVVGSPLLGNDEYEAHAFHAHRLNDMESQRTAIAIRQQHDLLVRNDETIKARDLLKSIPHTLEDHPIVVAIEAWAKKLDRHLSDWDAYADFYVDSGGGDCSVYTHERFLRPDTCMPRTRMLIDWLNEQYRLNPRTINVIEFGTFDGVNAVPVLTECAFVEYVAVDLQRSALDRMIAHCTKLVPDGDARLTTIVGRPSNPDQIIMSIGPMEFDAVVLFEVIEHVPDPVQTIMELRRWLDEDLPSSRLFMSTPCGSYDAGSPANMAERDARGHVRAMTIRDMTKALDDARMYPEEIYDSRCAFGIGNTMHVIARSDLSTAAELERDLSPIVFVVPSALWDWNSRHVHATGIGMSEEAIVYLAKEIKRQQPNRTVQVYGPVPEAEVHRGVEYWPREQLRHIASHARTVVSRGPSWHAAVEQAGALPGVLWLQDAWYPDMTAETAAKFDKIVVLTDWHEEAMRAVGVPHEKMVKINNFLIPEHFIVSDPPERLPHHFIYASSPDRGLIQLLEMWPIILARWPDATLDIFYGWEGCIKLAASNPAWAAKYQSIREKYDVLRWQSGVTERGRVNHVQLAREFMRASAWLYPCTEFNETGCATSFKAKAAGCIPVCTPRAALAESASDDMAVFVDEGPDFQRRFVDGIDLAILTTVDGRREMAERAIAEHGIANAVGKWLTVLDG